MKLLKILVAIDSFKGSMTSLEAGNSAMEGIKRSIPDTEVTVLPVADGGEGTVQALTMGMGGALHTVTVKNPIGEDICALYGVINKTAVIEIASACGIALISGDQLNPMNTTTFGVGQIIKDAISNGIRDFIIGIGGSATNDGGIGMLGALGFRFLDENREEVGYGAKELSKIKYIESNDAIPQLKECKFNIACDVTNPLCGDNGCTKIFAPQKGAKEQDIETMERGMESYAKVTKKYFPNADMNYKGAGAAGGLGFAFMGYLNGKLQSGIDLVLDKINIEQHIKNADLIVTGEGRIDSQTVMGKAPIGIAKLAKKYGKTVVAFSGCVTRDANICNKHGIDAIFPIVRGVCTLSEAMNKENAMANMTDCVEQVMNLIK